MEKKKINENMIDDFYNVKQSVVDSIKTALKDGKELDDAISEAFDTLIYIDDQWAIIQHYLTPDQTLDEGHTLIGIAEEMFYNDLYSELQDYDDIDESVSLKTQNDTDKYDRRAVEKEYGLEDGELDAFSIREAEDMIGCEEGELDRFLDNESSDNADVLNEGAGAGYHINGDLSDIKINKINKIDKFTSTNFLGTELEFATIDVDADAIFDGSASSYYYGDEIHDTPVKLTTLYVNPNLLHYLGLEEFEYDKITVQDLQAQINSTIRTIKSDVIGGGWLHATFDGNVESHSIDDDYKSFIDGVKFYFVNKDTIEYIDKAVSGELEENNDDNDLNESVSEDAQEVVNPVMADALRDQEKAEEVKEKATEITKDGKPTIKNESLVTFDPFLALGKLEENIKRGI